MESPNAFPTPIQLCLIAGRHFPGMLFAKQNLKASGRGTECMLTRWLVVLFEFEGEEVDTA